MPYACQRLTPPGSVAAIVKEILFFEDTGNPAHTAIPFFADGYPGLLFHLTPGGQWTQPLHRHMPAAYLYGQSMQPVTLHMKGGYRIIDFQLQPSAISTLFGIDAAGLKDGYYDLKQHVQWATIEKALLSETDVLKQITSISYFIEQLIILHGDTVDLPIKSAVDFIIDKKGHASVHELSAQVHLTRRTFERRFLKAVGLPPRDFIQVTRFNEIFEQLHSHKSDKLTQFAYDNGYADQSHFIRVFKNFTGQSPAAFMKKRMGSLN